MKTSEIAAYCLDKNPRLWIGGECPLTPLVPVTSRRRLDVGWFAFQLIKVYEANLAATNGHGAMLWFHPGFVAFAFFLGDFSKLGWERVAWDGYGDVESWKEVAG